MATNGIPRKSGVQTLPEIPANSAPDQSEARGLHGLRLPSAPPTDADVITPERVRRGLAMSPPARKRGLR